MTFQVEGHSSILLYEQSIKLVSFPRHSKSVKSTGSFYLIALGPQKSCCSPFLKNSAFFHSAPLGSSPIDLQKTDASMSLNLSAQTEPHTFYLTLVLLNPVPSYFVTFHSASRMPITDPFSNVMLFPNLKYLLLLNVSSSQSFSLLFIILGKKF